MFSRVSANTVKESVCVAGQRKMSSSIVSEVTGPRNYLTNGEFQRRLRHVLRTFAFATRTEFKSA